MEYLEGMLQKEKDNFSRVCNRLLGTCFLYVAGCNKIMFPNFSPIIIYRIFGQIARA